MSEQLPQGKLFEWVDVCTREPAEGHYIVADMSGFRWFAYHDGNGRWNDSDGVVLCVRYWLPVQIPDAPKEEKQAREEPGE